MYQILTRLDTIENILNSHHRDHSYRGVLFSSTNTVRVALVSDGNKWLDANETQTNAILSFIENFDGHPLDQLISQGNYEFYKSESWGDDGELVMKRVMKMTKFYLRSKQNKIWRECRVVNVNIPDQGEPSYPIPKAIWKSTESRPAGDRYDGAQLQNFTNAEGELPSTKIFGYTDEDKRLLNLVNNPYAAITPDMKFGVELMKKRPRLLDEHFANKHTGYYVVGTDIPEIILKVNDYVEYDSIHDGEKRYMYVSGFSL